MKWRNKAQMFYFLLHINVRDRKECFDKKLLFFNKKTSLSGLWSDSIHPVNVVLVKVLDLLPLQLEGGRDEAGVRVPDVVDQADGSGDLELLELELEAVVGQLTESCAGQISVLERGIYVSLVYPVLIYTLIVTQSAHLARAHSLS